MACQAAGRSTLNRLERSGNIISVWKRSRFDGVSPGKVFRPGQCRYRYCGYRKTLRFGFAPGDEEFTVEALEFEPLSRPDQAHVYLLLPVHPADHTIVAVGLPQVIAALVQEFRLLWHLRDWPDGVPGCGIVVAPAGPESGWWRGWPWTSPGIEIPVKWLRGVDTFDVRLRSERHEAPIEDVAACLDATLPVWPTGTNEASVVATWQPGDRPAICPIPVDRMDYWLACRYAAQDAARLPGRGFADLALATYRTIIREAAERNAIIDVAEARSWTPAALIRPPEQPVVHEEPNVSLIDAAHLMLGSASTPLGVGRAVVRLFADPMRGGPVVVPVQDLPVECLRFIREARVSNQASPRARHLLETAAERTGHDSWRLCEDRHNGALYLYAISETHVAWLPVGDRSHPHRGRGLLPDEPDTVHLVRDSGGSLGGWVRGIDESFTPLPNINGRMGTVPALAAIVTGQVPRAGASGDRLERLLRQIPEGGRRTFPWHQLRAYAEEFEKVDPDHATRLPFCSGDEMLPEGSASAPASVPMVVLTDLQADFDKLEWKRFEELVRLIAKTRPEVADANLNGSSGHRQDGVDIICRLKTPADPARRYLTIQCKNTKSLSARDITNIVDEFLTGEWAAQSAAFFIAARPSVKDGKAHVAIDQQAALLARAGVTIFQVWDGPRLSEKLRSLPGIVSQTFGPHYAEHFCGTLRTLPDFL